MAITQARMVFWVCSRNDDFTLISSSSNTLKVYRNPSKDSYNTITNNPITSENENWYCKSFISNDGVYYTKDNIYPFGIGYDYYPPKNNPIEIESLEDTSKQFIIDCIGVSSLTNVTYTFPNFSLPNAATNTKYFLFPPSNTWVNKVFTQLDINKFKYWVNELESIVTPNNALRFYIIGHFESVSVNYKVIDNFANCTKDNQQKEIEPNTSYEVTFTPNDGYLFNNNNKPYATCGGVVYQSTLNQDGTATITINNVSGNIIIDGGAVKKYDLNLELYNCILCNEERLYFRSSDYQTTNKLISNNSENLLYVENSNSFRTLPNGTKLFIKSVHDASGKELLVSDESYLYISDGIVKLHWFGNDVLACNIDVDVEYLYNYVLDGETYKLTLHSNDGFIFKTFPTWTMGNEKGQFSLNADDKTIATINWNLYNYITISESLSIQANATLSASLKYGFVSIYNPTFDEVDKLSKKRFYSVSQEQMLDLSQYIISFRKLYVDIPQITRELVYFGEYNTNVSSNIVTTNFIETDCGEITINELYNNSLDYNGVSIELYLPFIGNVSLNPNDVYNKQLHLFYRTNPLNGDCVAIVYSNNKQIIYSQGNVSFEVPINFKYGNLNNYGTSDNSLYMCDLTPYIEIRTPRQYQNMDNSLLNNNLWVNMNECSGFCQFGEVELVMINNINKDAYDEIISLLLQGVDF